MAAHQLRGAARMVREHLVLEWTHVRPDKEGYYWHRLADSCGRPAMRRIYCGPEGLLLEDVCAPIKVELLDEANLWLGPLPLPPVT